MSHRQCPKRLWLETYRPDLAEAGGAEAAFAAGHAVGDIAQRLHPGGELIEATSHGEELELTQAALSRRPRRPVYEATFQYDGTLTRADLLLPERRGYRLVEVKAAGSVKPQYLEDVAIQAWVMENAGLAPRHIEIGHVDTGFVYPGGEVYDGLLAYENVKREVRSLVGDVPKWVRSARRTLAGDEPAIEPGPHCSKPYDCPFQGYCIGEPEPGTYPLSDLPRGGKVARELETDGYEDLRDVPPERLSSARHRLVHRAVNAGEAVFMPEAGQILRRLGWPRRYLDFETLQFAVPIWAGTRPYQQVPFQWSCHVESRRGKVHHHEFLAEAGEDPRRAFAESLVDVLGDDDGPIFVYYAAFERSRMEELAESFPDLAPALEAAIARLVDLHPLVREHYYHPGQHGSWSLKAVLPAIAPELDYGELKISAGGMAAESYRKLLEPELDEAEAAGIRAALREYCQRDTYALVRIARFLQGKEGP